MLNCSFNVRAFPASWSRWRSSLVPTPIALPSLRLTMLLNTAGRKWRLSIKLTSCEIDSFFCTSCSCSAAIIVESLYSIVSLSVCVLRLPITQEWKVMKSLHLVPWHMHCWGQKSRSQKARIKKFTLTGEWIPNSVPSDYILDGA